MPRRFKPPWTARGLLCFGWMDPLHATIEEFSLPSMSRSLNVNVAPASRSVGLSLGCARPRPNLPCTPAMSRGRNLLGAALSPRAGAGLCSFAGVRTCLWCTEPAATERARATPNYVDCSCHRRLLGGL